MQPARNTQLGADLERIFAGQVDHSRDRTLLADFVGRRDEAAFEALVVRHGPMVRGVCGRILAAAPDVDDAFQATFLVLFLHSRRIEDGDRLAPWLFGVATRVALKARARAARRRQARTRVEAHAVAPAANHDLLDVIPSIDAEIARLPPKLRDAVVLCLVEGATPAEAAARLGCPVGTVKSRLARGREALRARLTRRGFAPAIPLAALDLLAPAPVSPTLVRATIAAVLAPPSAPALLTLTRGVAPTMLTQSSAAAFVIGGIVLAAGGITTAWLKSSAHAQQPQAAQERRRDEPPTPPKAPEPKLVDAQPAAKPLADRLAAIKAEYEADQATLRQALEQAQDQHAESEVYAKMAPDEVAYCRRMIDLAQTSPADPAARDALIWVINKPGRPDEGAYGDEFARAAALLVRHHGDDPAAVAVGLRLNNSLTAHRDALLLGFVAAAKGREARGTARLALAEYLTKKAQFVASTGQHPQRTRMIYVGADADGKHRDEGEAESDEHYAYRIGLSLGDSQAIRAEAERLYDEVIADYGDVPYLPTRLRELAALLREPKPTRNGKPLTEPQLQQIRTNLARQQTTLGATAAARLDELDNLAPGQPAPAIDGTTLDGQPLKLADYRGKVVVLVFWGSWCGPCMREVPHERELAARLKDRPFAILSVDCNEDKATGLKAAQANQMTWPIWHDGPDRGGPIASRYHVRGFPTVFVIDAQGIIRHKQAIGTGLDKAVADLLATMDALPAR